MLTNILGADVARSFATVVALCGKSALVVTGSLDYESAARNK